MKIFPLYSSLLVLLLFLFPMTAYSEIQFQNEQENKGVVLFHDEANTTRKPINRKPTNTIHSHKRTVHYDSKNMLSDKEIYGYYENSKDYQEENQEDIFVLNDIKLSEKNFGLETIPIANEVKKADNTKIDAFNLKLEWFYLKLYFFFIFVSFVVLFLIKHGTIYIKNSRQPRIIQQSETKKQEDIS